MVWLLVVALFVVALAYALLLKVDDAANTTPYRTGLSAQTGGFDE